MKKYIKILSIFLCALMICSLFAGCGTESSETSEITDDTMLIAYTEDQAPFLYTDENGNLTGFDVELIAATFDSFKGDYKNYQFIKVDEGYRLGEDVAYTDDEGNEYDAIIYCAVHKDTGTINEDYNWSSDIITNDVVTLVSSSSSIGSYNDLEGARAGIVSETAATALAENASVFNALASAHQYQSADEAFAALDAGEIDAVIIDDFNLYKFDGYANYTMLNGTLGSVKHGFAFAKSNDFSTAFNEAVLEISSTDYSESDTLTPLVEKYFGTADVLSFNYVPEEQ